MNLKKLIPPRALFWLIPIVIGLLYFVATIPAIAQEQTLRTLTVQGQGIETVSATIAEVNLGVQIQGETAAEVQQELAEKTSEVVKLLQSRDVEQLQTTGVFLQPNSPYSNNNRKLDGYIGSNTFSFQYCISEVGALIDEVVAVGVNRINSIRFTAKAEELAIAQQEALRKATLDAQNQANTVLKTVNFTAQEIVGIEINGANISNPQFIGAEQFSTAQVNTTVVGGEEQVTAFVTLQIRY
ncbi:MAG: SIMPL domain-containing protein [Cyanobacteria bacterium P01_F01_bin.143]